MKKEITNPALKTWVGLNKYIMTVDEEECQKLLIEEQNGRARKQFIHRIHCRLNRVRAERERAELLRDNNGEQNKTTKAGRN